MSTSSFCAQCGAILTADARFCSSCGATVIATVAVGAAAPTATQEPLPRPSVPVTGPPAAPTGLLETAPPPPPPAPPGAHGWAVPAPGPGPAALPSRSMLYWLIPVVALALVLLAVLVTMLVSGGDSSDKPSYAAQVAPRLAALESANRAFDGQTSSLAASTPPLSIGSAARSAMDAVTAARQQLVTIETGSDQQLAAALTAALDSEQQFLSLVETAASAPKNADGADVRASGTRMSSAFTPVTAKVSGITPPVSADEIANWLTSVRRTSTRRASIKSFIARVDGILEQSRPGKQKISQVAIAIQNETITVADARAQISDVVANREAVLASTMALPTPTSGARTVKEKLAESFRRSLDNDRDFQDGVTAYESGNFARYLNEVYDQAFASSSQAQVAKRSFLRSYNQMRSARGMSAVPNDF